MSFSEIGETAGAVLPLGLLPAATALVADYQRAQSRVVADDLAAWFGRPVGGRQVARVWSIRRRRTGRWPTARS